MLTLGAIVMRILMLLHTGSMWFASSEHNQLPHNTRGERADLERNAQLLSRSVASLCCFHTAKWCLSGLSAPQAQDLITTIFLSLWSSTVSAPTFQHQVVRYGGRSTWWTSVHSNMHWNTNLRKLNNNNWYCHLKTLRTLTLRTAALSDQHSGIWFVFSQFFFSSSEKGWNRLCKYYSSCVTASDFISAAVLVRRSCVMFLCIYSRTNIGSIADSSKRGW